MMIEEQDDTDDADGSADETAEIKVKVPIEYQLALHELKAVTGKQISTAVTEAIEMYFREIDEVVEAQAADEDTL